MRRFRLFLGQWASNGQVILNLKFYIVLFQPRKTKILPVKDISNYSGLLPIRSIERTIKQNLKQCGYVDVIKEE